MNDKTETILVRKAFVPEKRRPIPLWLDGPLICEWIRILVYVNSFDFELVFYDINGEPREWLFRESMMVAMQEGKNICGWQGLKWIVCHKAQFSDDRIVRWSELESL